MRHFIYGLAAVGLFAVGSAHANSLVFEDQFTSIEASEVSNAPLKTFFFQNDSQQDITFLLDTSFRTVQTNLGDPINLMADLFISVWQADNTHWRLAGFNNDAERDSSNNGNDIFGRPILDFNSDEPVNSGKANPGLALNGISEGLYMVMVNDAGLFPAGTHDFLGIPVDDQPGEVLASIGPDPYFRDGLDIAIFGVLPPTNDEEWTAPITLQIVPSIAGSLTAAGAPAPVPVPAAIWLFVSSLTLLLGSRIRGTA